jgi:cell division protein FtsQ
VVALSAVGITALLHSPVFAVESIEITGAFRSDAVERVAATGIGEGALLLYVDTDAIADAVLDDPWVLDARVGRIWPDVVTVEVLERDPLMWIEGLTGWMLVARDGTVVERSAAPSRGLMQAAVAFPDRSPGEVPIDPAWSELVEMALVLADDIGGTLRLELRGPELWTVAFGHEVRIGHPIDLADKGRTMRALLAGDVPDGAIIDVTSPIRPAIVPPEVESEVEASDGET